MECAGGTTPRICKGKDRRQDARQKDARTWRSSGAGRARSRPRAWACSRPGRSPLPRGRRLIDFMGVLCVCACAFVVVSQSVSQSARRFGLVAVGLVPALLMHTAAIAPSLPPPLYLFSHTRQQPQLALLPVEEDGVRVQDAENAQVLDPLGGPAEPAVVGVWMERRAVLVSVSLGGSWSRREDVHVDTRNQPHHAGSRPRKDTHRRGLGGTK